MRTLTRPGVGQLFVAPLISVLITAAGLASEPPDGFGNLLFGDAFERSEAADSPERPGKNWGTNSKARAQGVKQVFLRDGALFIKMAAVADHGVSVTQDVDFTDAVIRMRFKLGKGDDLGVNIADMQEKSVHAGHLCMPRIRLNGLEIRDLKSGRMEFETHTRSKAKQLTSADRERIAENEKKFPLSLTPDAWHDLEIKIVGDTMTVIIDGKTAGELSSPGIGHPTKRRVRLAVNREAWVDDIEIFGPAA